jgi:hypothetical protein
MDNRLLLHEKLKTLVGTNNVYFQPPASVLLAYPCVIYNIGKGESIYADNKLYNHTHKYDLIFIYQKPTTAIIEQVLGELSMSTLDRAYISDNLHHYAFSVYF